MTDRAPGARRPSFVSRTPSARVRWGATALGVGLALVVVATLAFGFVSRIDGNVEATGTIQNGYSIDDPSADEKQSSGYGVYEVAYRIDGADHVGFILGDFTVGETIHVKAPADGSPYQRLTLADSLASKIFSWVFMLIGVALTLAGAYWLTRGIVARNAQIRAQVNLAYGLPASVSGPAGAPASPAAQPQPYPTGPPAGRVVPPPPPPPEDRNDPPKGFFTAPYDI